MKGNGIAPGHDVEETIHITQFMHHGWELFVQMQESIVPISPSTWLCRSVIKIS